MRYVLVRSALRSVAAAMVLISGTVVFAQQFARPYNGIQAGLDAYARGEAQRRDAIDRQIGLNEELKWQAAYSTPSTVFYNPYIPGPYPFSSPFRFDRWSSWYDDTPVWPRIVGPGFYDPVPQPIGQQQIQTGPNRWESHPVFADRTPPPPPEPATLRSEVLPLHQVPAEPTPRLDRGREF